MKDLTSRRVLLLGVIVLAALFLAPTIQPGWFGPGWISKPISLGLDLSGGVHLVYGVQAKEAVKSRLQQDANGIRTRLRNEKIAVVRAVANDKNEIEIVLASGRRTDDTTRLIEENYKGLIFVGRTAEGERDKLTYTISAETAAAIEDRAVKQAVETLRNRVDQFGVAEPLIQTAGGNRILLQMPGVQDVEKVKRVVGSVAKLEFRLVARGKGEEGATKTLKDREGAEYILEEEVLMTGDAVDTASSHFLNGQMEVLLGLTTEGARTFRNITQENVGRQLAIVLDNVVYSAPVIRERISGGSASISGSFSAEEANQLAIVLRAGALPAPLEVLEERTVGPTLGQESIEKGIMATAIGIVFIFSFMTVYYRKAGVLAASTLVLNAVFLLAMLAAFGATLTLPGLAGLALTVGMAVDSNVIIFERIRDELRNGAGRDAAVATGFDKAFSAIADSNVTTLLAAAILYFLGSGPIRGFAVTLTLGILSTLFCAVIVTRLGFDSFALRGRKEALSI